MFVSSSFLEEEEKNQKKKKRQRTPGGGHKKIYCGGFGKNGTIFFNNAGLRHKSVSQRYPASCTKANRNETRGVFFSSSFLEEEEKNQKKKKRQRTPGGDIKKIYCGGFGKNGTIFFNNAGLRHKKDAATAAPSGLILMQ